jgi:integrase
MKNNRKKGDGNFTTLKSGTIEFTVSLGFDENGKRVRKKFYGKTRAECRKKYQKHLAEGDEPKSAPETQPQELKLADWIDEWLSTYKANKVEASSYEDYQNLASHVQRNKLGSINITQVKSKDVTAFFNTAIAEYSHSFRKRMKFLLNAAFNSAIDNDICIKNPVRSAEIASKEQGEREPFTESETGIIVNFAKSDDLFGLAMFIMLNTGIRSGEMRALTTDRINLDIGFITIDRACKRSGELGKPKNNKTRYIPLEDDVIEFLRERLSQKSGYIIGGDYFVSREGFRSRYLHFFNRMNKHLETTGAEPIPFKSAHCTRHTFGTLRQKHGMPIAMVSALLGHCSTEVTDKYTHLGDIATLTESVNKYPFLKLLA